VRSFQPAWNQGRCRGCWASSLQITPRVCLQDVHLSRADLFCFFLLCSGTPDLSPLAERWRGYQADEACVAAGEEEHAAVWLGRHVHPSRGSVSSEGKLWSGSVASPGPEAFLSYLERSWRDSRPGIRRLRSATLPCSMANIEPLPSGRMLNLLQRVCRAFPDEGRALTVSRDPWSSTPTRSTNRCYTNAMLRLRSRRLLLPGLSLRLRLHSPHWDEDR